MLSAPFDGSEKSIGAGKNPDPDTRVACDVSLCAQDVSREGNEVIVRLVRAGRTRLHVKKRRDGTREDDAGNKCDVPHVYHPFPLARNKFEIFAFRKECNTLEVG